MENKREHIVLMHEPGEELFLGVIHPDAALFADYMDIRALQKEHQAFRGLLSERGFTVHTIRGVLLCGTLDENGNPISGNDLDQLRAFAGTFLEICAGNGIDNEAQQRYKTEIIDKAHPEDLVRIIINRPKISISTTDTNTGFAAEYSLSPMMNLYFMRDQLITTAKGVVIGNLSSPQRLGESRVAEYCIRKLGIYPILEIENKSLFLEGGDFITFEDRAFICCGMRTSPKAVEMMLDKHIFGTKYVVAIKDSLWSQSQMHLDTYFNMIDNDLCALAGNRVNAKIEDKAFLVADIYELSEAEYVLIAKDKPLTEYLQQSGIDIISVEGSDMSSYGTNFIPIAPREIVAVAGKSEKYISAMEKHGVTVHWVDLAQSILGYGAAHCMTQFTPAVNRPK